MSLNPINSENIFREYKRYPRKHKSYPTAHKISQTFMTNEKFSFKFVTEDQVKEVIMNLDGSKATPIGGIFLDILKSTIDFYLPSIANSINLSIKKGCFSE